MKALSLSLAVDQATLPAPEVLPEVALACDAPVWIGLHFPTLALEVCDFPEGLPSLVIGQSGNQQVVHAACSVAMDHGIVPGMSLNAAHVLCPNLAVRLRDPKAEYRRLCQISEQLLCFTPTISLGQWRSACTDGSRRSKKNGVTGPEDNADSLLLEVSGSLCLFGGLEALLENIRAEFGQPLADSPLISAAPCPAAALLMARNGLEQVVMEPDNLKSALGEIPLRGVDLEHKLVDRLLRCGLRTLRDLWRLPREDLGRRFGAGLLHYLDRLSGIRSDPLRHVHATLCFRQRMELPSDTRHSRLIMIAAEKLLGEAERFLQMNAAATEKISFDLWHVNRARGSHSRTTLEVRSAQADRRSDRFLPQFEEQLGRATMENEVNAVSITIDQVVPFTRSSEDLFSRRDRQTQDWTQLMDLLAARLGQDRVYTLMTVADHRPERAWRRVAPSCVSFREQDQDQTLEQALPTRPLWLLDVPQKIDSSGFSIAGDTERVEAGWWERRDRRRDYRVADAPGGRRCWVYRDLRTLKKEIGPWRLHGLFG
ncbi:MAG: DNA polymerase Y family protein [Arenicellales bacterium]